MKTVISGTEKIGQKRQPWGMYLFSGLVFVCFYIFFTESHPLYILDLDDWWYTYFSRSGLPDANEWNPSRILPEIWMPLTSFLGSYFIYPITGDFIQSLTMMYSITFALVIVVYMLLVGSVLQKRFQVGTGELMILLSIFLLGHFLPFILDNTGNVHLLYAHNVTCVFYYTLSALWNFILCCIFLTEKEKTFHPLARAVFYLAIYLAIFSNLFQSVILMSLFGIRLLFALIEGIWNNYSEKKPLVSWSFIKHYLVVHYEKLLWILLWLVCMGFELAGGRAKNGNTSLALGSTLLTLKYALQNMNVYFCYGMAIINLLAIAVALWKLVRNREGNFLLWQLESVACMALTIVFLVLLCSKVNPEYIARADVMISWMVWLMLMSISSVAYLLKSLPKTIFLLPMLLFLLMGQTVLDNATYADYFVPDIGASVVKAVGDDIIAQVKTAEDQGMTKATVYIPESLTNGWPLDTNLLPPRISDALWFHGVTDWHIDVTLVPSPEKDVEFHLD